MHISADQHEWSDPTDHVSRPDSARVLFVTNEVDLGRRLFSAIRELGFDIEYAESSRRAFEILTDNPGKFGVVVLDAASVIKEGYNIAETIRCDAKLRPISVATVSRTDLDAARVYASAGLMPLYKIDLPFRAEDVKAQLSAAIADTNRTRNLLAHLRGTAESLHILDTCRFKIRTLRDIEPSVYMAAACFSQPERAVHGLQELLLNAIEHGNLEIGFKKKSELLHTGRWVDEIEARLASEDLGRRYVDFAVVKRDTGTSAVISDQGPGFDWQSILNGNLKTESFSNGRGISRSRLISFDKIAYNDLGNRVVAFMKNSDDLSW